MALIEHTLDQGLGGEPAGGADRPGSEAQKKRPKGLNPILFACAKHYLLIGICIVAGAFGGLVLGALKTNVYECQGKLWLKAGMRENVSIERALAGGGAGPQRRISAAVQTELYLLRTRELFQRVVDRVGPDALLEVPDPRASDDKNTPLPTRLLHRLQAWIHGLDRKKQEPNPDFVVFQAIDALDERLRLTPDEESGVIWVAIEGPDPYSVQDILNSYLEEAEKYHTDYFRVSKQQEIALEAQNEAAEAYRKADEELKNYRIEHGIFDLDRQQQALHTQINEALARRNADTSELRGLEGRVQRLQSRLDSSDPMAAGLTERVENPRYVELRRQRDAAYKDWREIVQRDDENPSEFKARRKQAMDLIEKIDGELQQQEETIVRDTERKHDLVGRLDEAQEDLAALKAAKPERDATLDRLQGELRRLQSVQNEYENLRIRREQAKSAYDQLRARLESLSWLSRMDDDDIGNLRVFQRAAEPGEKIGPQRGKSVAFGLILGGALGLGLAFVLVIGDANVRRPGDVLKFDELVPIATMPLIRGKERKEPGIPTESKTKRPEFLNLSDALWPRIQFASNGKRPFRVGVLGVGRDTGATTVASALAYGLAGKSVARVLLVESAVSPLGVAHRFACSRAPGLSEVLRGETSFGSAVQDSGQPRLDLLTFGEAPRLQSGKLGAAKIQEKLSELEAEFGFVVHDVAPIADDVESLHLLWRCDYVLLVARQDRSKKAEIRQALDQLEEAGVPARGIVLTHVRSVWPFWMPASNPEMRLF